MMWRDTVDLVTISVSENEIGDLIEVPAARTVFANKKSVRQSEFYQAMATGLKPEIMFQIRSIEYSDEPKLIYDGKEYRIIRTHSLNDEIMELICTGWVAG